MYVTYSVSGNLMFNHTRTSSIRLIPIFSQNVNSAKAPSTDNKTLGRTPPVAVVSSFLSSLPAVLEFPYRPAPTDSGSTWKYGTMATERDTQRKNTRQRGAQERHTRIIRITLKSGVRDVLIGCSLGLGNPGQNKRDQQPIIHESSGKCLIANLPCPAKYVGKRTLQK